MHGLMPKRKTALAKKLVALRESLKITQAIAAQRTGVSVFTWVAWENGKAPGRLAKQLLRNAFPKLEI